MTTAIETTIAPETTIAADTLTTATETPTTAPIEPTDEALIARAKGLNKQMETHLRKGIEAFYRLGEILVALKKRTHLHADGRWSSILKEVGVSTTTDNHARRFSLSCEFTDLGRFKNKTEALRTLGILATPEGAKKEPADRATKPTAPLATNEPDVRGGDVGNGGQDAAPAGDNGDITQEPRAGAVGKGPQAKGVTNPGQTGDDKDLLIISRIAALLEELADKGLAPTADDRAHLDRIAAAVARLKEVGVVAAA